MFLFGVLLLFRLRLVFVTGRSVHVKVYLTLVHGIVQRGVYDHGGGVVEILLLVVGGVVVVVVVRRRGRTAPVVGAVVVGGVACGRGCQVIQVGLDAVHHGTAGGRRRCERRGDELIGCGVWKN